MNMINLSLVFAAFHGVRIYNRYFIYSTTAHETYQTGKSVQRGCTWKYDFTKQPHPFIQYLNDDKLNVKGTILTTNNMTTSPNTLQFHINIDKYKVIIWSSILYMSWSYSRILIGKYVLKSTG